MMNASSSNTTTTPDLSATYLGFFVVTNVGCIVAVFGNSLVILAVRRFPSLQTIAHQLLLSLACTDLLTGVLVMASSVSKLSLVILGRDSASATMVRCYVGMVQLVPGLTSVTHLMAIAVDRFVAVVYPLHYHSVVTPQRITGVIVFLWCYSAVTTTVFLATAQWSPEQLCSVVHIGNPIVMIGFIIGPFGISFLFMCLLYAKIFMVARLQAKKISDVPLDIISSDGCSETRPATVRKELKAAKRLSLFIGFFMLCFLTFFVLVNLWASGYEIPNFMLVYRVALFLMYLNSVLNPVVHAGTDRRFRQAFRNILYRVDQKASENVHC